MKKTLLLFGVIFLIPGVLSLLFAALSLHGYYHILDGSSDLYVSLWKRAIIFGILGIILVIAGTALLYIRSKQ